MRRMGMGSGMLFGSMSSSSMFDGNSVRYCCMSCGMQHKQAACPKCGSKMKRVGAWAVRYLGARRTDIFHIANYRVRTLCILFLHKVPQKHELSGEYLLQLNGCRLSLCTCWIPSFYESTLTPVLTVLTNQVWRMSNLVQSKIKSDSLMLIYALKLI